MVGNVITSAPLASSRSASAPACARGRVTTMRRPKSGRSSNHAIRSRSVTTLPTTTTPGASSPAARTRAASVPAVATTVACAPVVPPWTAAAEEEGIAVLQAHDGLPGARALDQQGLDGRLARPVAVGVRAAERDHLRPGADEVEETRADQAVVHDDVGRGEAALAAPGEEARVAGPRAPPVDAAAQPPTISPAPGTSTPSARARP